LRNEPITVYGDGRQSRCFGYVHDAIEALIRISKAPNVGGEVLNIGNNEEVTILGLAQAIKKCTGSRSDIVFMPYDQVYGPGFEDMFRRVPSLEKLERLIGYRPRTSLNTIIQAVAEGLPREHEELKAMAAG